MAFGGCSYFLFGHHLMQFGKAIRGEWLLDPSVTFLNHGSFGATPRVVLDVQRDWQERLESEPVRFMIREFPAAIEPIRERLATFVGVKPVDIVFVENATMGVNAVLRSLQPTFGPGDELLTTSHVYGAVRKTLQYICDVTGATLVEAHVPFPIESDEQVMYSIREKLSTRTKFALIDHVTSSTGILLPIEKIIPMLQERGIMTFIDGAHVPGMLDLDIESLGVDFYTGNCHKWLFAPKGSAFLWAKPEHQPKIHPVVISQNYGLGYQMEFGWVGTRDFTAWLSIGAGMDFAESLGMQAIRDYNYSLLMQARQRINDALGVGFGAPESMLTSLCTTALPGRPVGTQQNVFKLHDLLIDRYGIEVPAMSVNNEMFLRFSTQVYNEASEYDKLAEALVDIFNSTSFA